MDALLALLGAMGDGLSPELGRERQIDRFVQPVAAGTLLRQDQLDRVDQRTVFGGGFQVQHAHHAQDGGAVALVERPQQRQVVVAAVGGDGIAVSLQGLDAPARADQAANLPSCVGVARVTVEHLDHIRHRGDDGLGLLAVARTQPLQFLLAAVVEIAHAFDEHLS